MSQKKQKCYLDKNAILNELIASGELKLACRRITEGSDLQHDLFQEAFIVIMNYPEEKLQELHRKKELMYFIVGILMNMWRSPRSDFYKTYRQQNNEFDTNAIIVNDDYDEGLDNAIKDVKCQMEKMEKASSNKWYKAKLLRLEAEHGSHMKIANATGINRRSISRAIADAKKEIKNNLRMSKITVIHPSRSRHEQANRTMINWRGKADSDKIEYILSVDADDPDLRHYRDMFDCLHINKNRSVVDAVNNAAKSAKGEIFVVVSDDFDCPMHWDRLISEAAVGREGAWAMKTDDGAQPWIITLPIVSRAWYELYGYVYHPDYMHMFCDTDMTTVAYMTAGYINAKRLIFPHNHYSTGLAAKDNLNERNDNTWEQGQAVYLERFVNDFYLPQNMIKKRLDPTDNKLAAHISWLIRMGVKNV
jgi:DNA-directed RNA polymerase specialized sigma24 family protein